MAKNIAETSTKNLFVFLFNLNLKIKIIDKLGFIKMTFVPACDFLSEVYDLASSKVT